mmetsp:Transcript_2484/g.8329  ORF Transcript_2484/g.8329 Transcript_2484/m.8329 type:complete len:247 (-) Transcript_2484:1707-2447(-)
MAGAVHSATGRSASGDRKSSNPSAKPFLYMSGQLFVAFGSSGMTRLVYSPAVSSTRRRWACASRTKSTSARTSSRACCTTSRILSAAASACVVMPATATATESPHVSRRLAATACTAPADCPAAARSAASWSTALAADEMAAHASVELPWRAFRLLSKGVAISSTLYDLSTMRVSETLAASTTAVACSRTVASRQAVCATAAPKSLTARRPMAQPASAMSPNNGKPVLARNRVRRLGPSWPGAQHR